MKILAKSLILATFLALAVGAAPAFAATPVLSASYQGSSSLQISVSDANPYSEVNLYSQQSSSLWTVISNIGQTDGNGNFNQVINLSTDGSSNPIQLYVTVAGLQSSTVSIYPNGGSTNCSYYNNCGVVGGLSLSQTSLSLNSGQSAYVTAINSVYGYSNSLYISSNSNSSVASASVSGNSVTVYGINSGSTSISICSNSGTSSCATLFVTVNGNGSNNCGIYNNCNNVGNLVLSQTSLVLTQGQSSTITASSNIYGGSVYISSNSNSVIASASVSDNTVYINAINSGNTNISICQNSGGSCATLFVTVSGSGCYSSNCANGSISLSQTSLSLNVGQSSTVTIYGNGSYYISNNSNSAVTSASISGNAIYLGAIGNGSSTITVCQSYEGSQCATLYVTVSGYGGSSSISFSQSNVNLALSQNMSINIYGNGSYYVSSNSNSAVATASITGSTLYLYGVGDGSSSITVCQSGYSGCGTVYVTVGNNNSCGIYNNCSTGSISLSQTSLNLSQGQSSTVTIYGNGSYYVSSNSNSSVASASISGGTLYVNPISTGSTNIYICQNSGGSCATLYVTVNSNNCSYNNCGITGSLSLSQNSLNLTSGQSSNVTISGNGSYYISSNSNPSVVGVSVSGNILYVNGVGSGSTNISICQNSGGSCVTLYVTVNGSGYGGAGVSLSQTSLSLSQGQTSTVNIYGGSGFGYYVSSNSNPGVAVVSQSGSVLSVYGSQSGSSTIQICQNNSATCATLYVTVGGSSSNCAYSSYSNCGGVTYPTGSVLGSSSYQNGELINSNGTVYIVYKNMETGFASSQAFTGLGFSFSNVVNGGSSGLVSSGYTVSTAYAQHPWGSWIKSGQTVYFVHQSGLIPVPNWVTFLNNGGQASWIVPANSYDFALPIMAPMTNNDSRLAV